VQAVDDGARDHDIELESWRWLLAWRRWEPVDRVGSTIKISALSPG
jgi:hypothetical protein